MMIVRVVGSMDGRRIICWRTCNGWCGPGPVIEIRSQEGSIHMYLALRPTTRHNSHLVLRIPRLDLKTTRQPHPASLCRLHIPTCTTHTYLLPLPTCTTHTYLLPLSTCFTLTHLLYPYPPALPILTCTAPLAHQLYPYPPALHLRTCSRYSRAPFWRFITVHIRPRAARLRALHR